jgi:alcohol dehydrogenase class IV
VIQFNRAVVEDRFTAIAQRLGLKGKLNKDLGLATTLQEFGVSEEAFNEHLDTMAKNAMEDPCTSTNPRETTVEQMKNLYKASFYGQEALVKA